MALPSISVLIPLKRLNPYVRECIEHLNRQTYTNFDVYVVTDDPETMDIPVDLKVHFLSSGPVPPNRKRMQAAAASDADLVALIDDDAYPVEHWLAAAVRHFDDPHVVAVGGPGVTPPTDAPSQQVSGAVYASPLVSAGYVYRYLPSAQRDVDDYPSCNLIVRRAEFSKHVPECLRYWPGEDTKLCLLLTKSGDRIIYDPTVMVYHHRRKLFWGHFKQVWNYSVHRGFFAKRYPDTSLRPAYFVPTIFVLGNFTFVALLLASRGLLVAGLAASAYVVAVLFSSVLALRQHRANPLAIALGVYLTHLTYGVGFLFGLTRGRLDH